MIERLCTKIAAVVSVCRVGYEKRGDDLFCHWNAAFAIDNGKKKREQLNFTNAFLLLLPRKLRIKKETGQTEAFLLPQDTIRRRQRERHSFP